MASPGRPRLADSQSAVTKRSRVRVGGEGRDLDRQEATPHERTHDRVTERSTAGCSWAASAAGISSARMLLAHHLQRRLAEAGIDMCHPHPGDHHVVVPYVGVQRGVEHALFGHLAGDHQARRFQLLEQIVQLGGVEARCAEPW